MLMSPTDLNVGLTEATRQYPCTGRSGGGEEDESLLRGNVWLERRHAEPWVGSGNGREGGSHPPGAPRLTWSN